MAKIVLKTRHVSSQHVRCPECSTDITVAAAQEMEMPYCGECGKIVLDAAQQYCCWCGEKFEGHRSGMAAALSHLYVASSPSSTVIDPKNEYIQRGK